MDIKEENIKLLREIAERMYKQAKTDAKTYQEWRAVVWAIAEIEGRE